MRAQNAACYRSFSCDELTECAEVTRRARLAKDCAEARKKVMDRCFEGGDVAHQREYRSVMWARSKCTAKMSNCR